MKSFLRDVAKDLLQKFGNNMSKVVVVFPGKRARLFMSQYLAEESDGPVWAPQYKTIDELFMQLSPYRKSDSIAGVCALYDIYAHLLADEALSIDEFYSWGEVILSDFDDIDKHMAPAEKIFQNVYDLQSISTNYLTKEQEEALRQFFKNFSIEGNTAIKERFLRLWSIMPQLYTELKVRLKEQGMLYSGALYREVAEAIKAQQKTATDDATLQGLGAPSQQLTYCFVGFNILDECEETLFRYCQEQYQARFYWDYDESYIHDPQWEAGIFIAQNRRIFPNALEGKADYDNLLKLKDVTFIATSTSNAQSRYVPQWIHEQLTERENETAIVLADEQALGSVLHSIPEEEPHLINVTMGYPLSDTPVFSFLMALMALYIDGYDANSGTYRFTLLEKLRRHPYHAFIDSKQDDKNTDEIAASLLTPKALTSHEVLERLLVASDLLATHFAAKDKRDVYEQLYTEALFKCHLIFTQFRDALPEVANSTLRRLLRQVLVATSIPFHGEPAIGMQVMGLLETRNLDFSHILMLGVGEGILPKKSDETSLIPYSLKESFGLTTIKHRISVFAYYFYRLIARAEHLTLMYNENSSGVNSNEMSRFMRQLMAETNIPIRYLRLMPENNRQQSETSLVVEKTDEMVQQLRQHYVNHPENCLSPTAINTYLACSLQFYFKYIAKLRIEDKPEDGLTPLLIGTVFHDAAQLFYEHIIHQKHTRVITSEMLENVLANQPKHLDIFINISLIINYFKPIEDEKKKREALLKYAAKPLTELQARTDRFYGDTKNARLLVGINHIIYGVLKQYLVQLVRYDKQHTPFTLHALEEEYTLNIELEPGQIVKTGGRIDRLEVKENEAGEERYIVVDYKTGGSIEPEKDLETIFSHKNKQDGYFLQTFIYAMAVQESLHALKVQPTLFYVNRAGNPATYDRSLRLGTKTKSEEVVSIGVLSEELHTKLKETVENILSPTVPFCPTKEEKTCKVCRYYEICKT